MGTYGVAERTSTAFAVATPSRTYPLIITIAAMNTTIGNSPRRYFIACLPMLQYLSQNRGTGFLQIIGYLLKRDPLAKGVLNLVSVGFC